MHKLNLILQNGTLWKGTSFGYDGETSGEVVFSTAMTSYPESLSDPSYHGQILVLTYPMIGNYGVPPMTQDEKFHLPLFFESHKPQIAGLVVNHYSENFHHWNAEKSLSKWLKENKIVGIHGVDTRAITKLIRDEGSMLGAIEKGEAFPTSCFNPHLHNLVEKVSCTEKIIYGSGKHRIILIDCGVKNNIIRQLLARDCTVIRVPFDYDYTQEEYDAVFVSNGPGNPEFLPQTIQHIQQSINEHKAVAGICLGCQLIGLALGSKVFKLKFGHRSHNQPVIDTSTQRCYITSQNHGYAIDSQTLPPDCDVWFKNLNDETCEGIRHRTKKILAVQFHPEAFGGPEDTHFFFDDFLGLL